MPTALPQELKKVARGNFQVEMLTERKAIVYLDPADVPRVIGKNGKTVDLLEKKTGISIDVREKKNEEIPVTVKKTAKYYTLQTPFKKTEVDLYIDSSYFTTARTSGKGNVRIQRKSKIGKVVGKALSAKAAVWAVPSEKKSR